MGEEERWINSPFYKNCYFIKSGALKELGQINVRGMSVFHSFLIMEVWKGTQHLKKELSFE